MNKKQKNPKDYIAFPLDVSSEAEALEYVKLLDEYVGVFKIGLELFMEQGPDMIRKIRNQTRADIFLDMKLHDICATVERAMKAAVRLGVDLITVHGACSANTLKRAAKAGENHIKVLGVTVLTDNNGKDIESDGFKKEFSESPEKLVLQRAAKIHGAGCAGVVCSGRETQAIKSAFGPSFLAVTPGIRPSWSLKDGKNQDDQKRITTPGLAIAQGSDLLVIGRPIRDAADPAKAARMVTEEIREALLWKHDNELCFYS